MTHRGTPAEALLACAATAVLTRLCLMWGAPISLLANLGVTLAAAVAAFYLVRRWYYSESS